MLFNHQIIAEKNEKYHSIRNNVFLNYINKYTLKKKKTLKGDMYIEKEILKKISISDINFENINTNT